MSTALKDVGFLQKYSKELGGVFSNGDLCRLFGQSNMVLLYRRIKILIEEGYLSRFCQGYYFTPGFNKDALCARINPNSYISFGNILAKEMMIGSVPETTLYAVKIGRNRVYKGAGLTLVYLGMSVNTFFGYTVKNGIRYASPEKALLDTLYYYQKGRKFSFNIYDDVDVSRLNLDVLYGWLKKYRNSKFISFVKGYLDDRS
jgi:hypothetical protein